MNLWEVIFMRIRDGFVTNSSSTSYIIISKEDLTGKYLAEKLGITDKSPNYYEIVDICNEMVRDGSDGFYHHSYEESSNYDLIKEIFGVKTANQFKKGIKKGYKVYCGRISSEENDYEITMCLDYLKYEDSDIFIDASDNVW